MSTAVAKDEFVFVVEPAPVSSAVVAMNTNAAVGAPPQIVVDVASMGGSADILQQALAEVTASTNKLPSASSLPVPLVANEDSNDLSFLLNSSATSNSESSILEQLGSIEPTPPSAQKVQTTATSSFVSFSANTVKTSMSPKETITLYKGKGSSVLPEVHANQQHKQQQQQPKLITSMAGAYAGVGQSTVAGGIQPGVVLVPNTSPNGVVTYMLKANPPMVTFGSVPQTTILNARAQQQHFLPAIIAPRGSAASAAGNAGPQLVTAAQQMRPVMATGIASSRPPARRPLLLPKLPVPVASALKSGAVIGQTASLPRVIPKQDVPQVISIEPLPEKVVVPERDEDWSAVVVGKCNFSFALGMVVNETPRVLSFLCRAQHEGLGPNSHVHAPHQKRRR